MQIYISCFHKFKEFINSIIPEIVTIGHRENIVINIGELTPMKNGLEVIVEEANGSKYMIPFERDHDSAIFKGCNISLELFYI